MDRDRQTETLAFSFFSGTSSHIALCSLSLSLCAVLKKCLFVGVCVCIFVCVLVAQHVMSVGGRRLQIDCGIAGQWTKGRHASSRVSTLKEGKWRIAISIRCLSVCQKAICAHRHRRQGSSSPMDLLCDKNRNRRDEGGMNKKDEWATFFCFESESQRI